MKKITWDEFQSAFSQSDPKLQELINSEKIFDCLVLKTEKTQELLLPFSYVLLNLVPKEELTQLCTELAIQEPQKFIEAILLCIQAEHSSQPATTAVSAAAPVSGSDGRNSSSAITPGVNITETKNETEPLHNIRTMSADMNVLRPQAEVVHTASSQADILARPPIAPSNTPVNSPRWDSEV